MAPRPGKPAALAMPPRSCSDLSSLLPSSLGFPAGNAEELGMDLTGVTSAVAELKAQVDAGRYPGIMSCVIKDGQVVHFQAYGFADICSSMPLTADTLFRFFSQTKIVTNVGAMRMLERGALGLDDPVSKYLPSFSKVLVGAKRQKPSRPMQIRDLMVHTSGVQDAFNYLTTIDNTPELQRAYEDLSDRVDRGEITSLAAWCDELATLPLLFQPGKGFGYGWSLDILGRVLEVISGQSLDQFLQAEVLKPLGMTDTSFAVSPDKASRLSALYQQPPLDGSRNNVKFITADPGGSGLTEDVEKGIFAQSNGGAKLTAPSVSVFLSGVAARVISGGGGVCSISSGLVGTMRDYARLCQMLLDDGELDGVRILEPESVQLLARDWLNDFTKERRKQPLCVLGVKGKGCSPLGPISSEAAGDALQKTVAWGGRGGSFYFLNWPHRVLCLAYTGCIVESATITMFRGIRGALHRDSPRPSATPRKRARSSSDHLVVKKLATPRKRARSSSDHLVVKKFAKRGRE